MTPTAKLRWLELPLTGTVGLKHPSAIPFNPPFHVRVLQQWWEREGHLMSGDVPGEWRDIPIARE